ncbi:MAG: P-loop NTPase fold protein [Ignavibacteriaceae bacterium]
MDSNKIKFRLLDDKPTSSDDFNAHDKVASSIAEMIVNEEGGKSISLIGHWGSGKSSIIEILKDKLKNKCRIFTFNAWAHEGDPLRRAFLESLISFFTINNLIEKEDWKEKLKQLSGNKESSEITDRRNPTNYGLLLIFSTTLLPIALTVLSLWPKISYLILILCIIVSVGPVIVFASFLIKYFHTEDKDKKKSILSLLINDIEKTVTSTSYKTIDPTSLEFQKEFHDLMNEASKDDDGKKLLIVIDNLDRIADEDALKIWSTMRTFFDFDNKENIAWLRTTWLLVPYDYSGLKKLWKNNSELQGNNNSELPGKNNSLITSFTEKTFQVSFNTPLLILSDSKKYFEDQFKDAFIGFSDDNEIHKVYRIFKELREPNNLPPTPREIKLFINQIISLYSQWKEEIPINFLSLFILLRKNKWAEDNKLISDLLEVTTDFLFPSLKDLVHEEYREYLAALYFNTQKDKALQLLLKEKLEKALINNDNDFIKERENLPGFTYVCEDIIQNNYGSWAKQEPNTLASVCHTLSSFSINEDDNIHQAWDLIYIGFKQIDSWKSLQKNSADGICTILKRKNNISFSKIVLSSLSKSMLFETQKSPDDNTLIPKSKEQLEEVIESLSKIITCVIGLTQTPVIQESFVINSSATTYLDIMLILVAKEFPKEIKNFFVPNCNKNSIVQELSKRIIGESFNDLNYYLLIKLLCELPLNLNLKEIIPAIDTRLRNLNMPSSEILYLLDTLMFLRKKETTAESTIKDLTVKGFIPNHLNLAIKQKDIYLQALSIYCILEFADNGSLQQNNGESQQGINFYKQVLGNPANYNSMVNELLNCIIKNDAIDKIFIFYNGKPEFKNLAIELIKLLYGNKELNKNISSDKFLEEETCFYNCLKTEEYYEVINEYVNKSNLAEEALKVDFIRELASLYIGIIKTEKGKTPETISFIKTGMLSLTQKDWQEEYNSKEVNCLDLILELDNYNIKSELKSSFLDQLKSFIESIIKGESISAKITSNWNKFVLALDDDNQKTLLKFFRDKINSEDKDLTNILTLFNKDIIKCEISVEDANDLVTQCFDKILSRKNLTELNWLKDLIEYCNEIIAKCDEAYLNSLKDKIKGIVKEESINEELKNIIKEIGKLIGTKKFVEEPEEE